VRDTAQQVLASGLMRLRTTAPWVATVLTVHERASHVHIGAAAVGNRALLSVHAFIVTPERLIVLILASILLILIMISVSLSNLHRGGWTSRDILLVGCLVLFDELQGVSLDLSSELVRVQGYRVLGLHVRLRGDRNVDFIRRVVIPTVHRRGAERRNAPTLFIVRLLITRRLRRARTEVLLTKI